MSLHVERQHIGYLIAALVLVVVVALNQTNGIVATSSGTPDYYNTESVRMFNAPMAMGDKDVLEYAVDGSIATTTATAIEQKVIKTGDLELEVDSAATTVADVTALATSRGGFVASSSVNEDAYGNKRGDITIRVPAADFEATMTDIKALADKVVSENSSGQDVTEEYTDIAARLNAAKAQEAQYLVILQSAKNVGEVLAVQEHLSDVRAQIESLQGQINYLENRTSMSTIRVSLVETSRILVPAEKFGLGDEIRDATRALVLIGQKILTAIIWLVVVGGPLAIIGYAGYRVVRRFHK